jgi:hypothetical protein
MYYLIRKERSMLSIPLQQQKHFLRGVRLYLYTAMVAIVVLVLVSLGLTWFSTNAQINISNTLTYVGRERTLTQKLLAETLQTVYIQGLGAKKNLKVDEADWTVRHDAIWHGNNALSILPVSTFPDISRQVNAVEPEYLAMHKAIDDVLMSQKQTSLRTDASLISQETTPLYNALESYNTYLRNLTTHYQTTILIYSIISTAAILVTVLLSILTVFQPAFSRLNKNVIVIVEADEKLKKQQSETEALLEEVRRADHNTRIPVSKIGDGVYAVQNGTRGYHEVRKVDGLFQCPCIIFAHNHFCLHIKYVQDAERTEALQQHR